MSGGNDHIQPDMSIEDRYYSKVEYRKLTPAQRKGLGIKRENRGHKHNSKGKQKITLSKRTIKTVAASVTSSLTDDTNTTAGEMSDDDDTSEDEEVPMKASKKSKSTTNCNNPALQRGKKKN